MTENVFCRLDTADFRLEVCPTAGASVTLFQKKSPDGTCVDIFRPFAGDRAGRIDPFACSCVSMYPYTNRISNGVLHYKGQAFGGFPLHGAEPNSLHGDAKDAVWTVTEQTARRLVLMLDKRNGETPYKYTAEQIYELTADGLIICMKMINTGPELPFSAGQHPYFPVKPRTTITADLPQMEVCDLNMQYQAIVPTPPDCDFSQGRRILDFTHTGRGFQGRDCLDNAFLGQKIGQGDTGRIDQPEDGVSIVIHASPVTVTQMDAAGQITAQIRYDSTATTIYIPPPNLVAPENNYVCYEPGLANIVDEFNLHEQGITHRPLPILAQGDRYDSFIRYEVLEMKVDKD